MNFVSKILKTYSLRIYGNKILRRDRIELTSNYPLDSAIMRGNVAPTVFYLEEINSDLKNIATFKREWHYPTEDTVEITRGRAYITEFSNYKITIGNEDLKIQALDRTINCKIFDTGLSRTTRKKVTFNNAFQEINTPYSYFYNNDNHYNLYMIDEIYDPEQRKTKFDYNYESTIEYYGFSHPYSNFSLYKPVLISITEPTKKYEIEYFSNYLPNPWRVNYENLVNNPGNLNNGLLAVTKQIKEYEVYNLVEQGLIRSFEYSFLEPCNNFERLSIINSSVTTGGFETTKYYLKEFSTNSFKNNPDETYRNPDLKILLPVQIEISDIGNKWRVQELKFKFAYQIGGKSKYTIFIDTIVSKTRFIDSTSLITGLDINEYNFFIIEMFGGDTLLSNNFGEKILNLSSYKYHPSNWNLLLKKSDKNFLHFPLLDLSNSRVDSVWNKVLSNTINDSLRYLLNLEITDFRFSSLTFPKWYLPPLYNLTLSESDFDGNNSFLQGKLFKYNFNFSYADVTNRRGVLLSESIVNKDRSDTVIVAEYQYRGGKSRNLLTELKNRFGAYSRNYYFYSDIPGYLNEYPSGKKLHNNDSISQVKIYKSFFEYENPIANDIIVRKFKPFIGYYSDTLRTFLEKTFYGQNAALIDQNGWYFSNEYDKNGRILYSWEPFDYPVCDVNTVLRSSKIHLFNKKTKIEKTNDVINYATQTVTHPSYSQTQIMTSSLIVGNTIDASIPFGINQIQNDIIQVKTKASVTFDYIASNYDVFHSGKSISEAYLQLAYAGNYVDECMMLRITSDKFNLEKRFVIGCPALQFLEDTIAFSAPAEMPFLKVDLLSIIDSLKNLSVGSKVTFEISSLSIEGQLEIMNLSEDQAPCIIISYIDCDPYQDYTRAFKYNDSSRTTTYSNKIDDGLHTSNLNWERTYSIKDGRYFGSVSYFGIDNVLRKNELLIGSPVNPKRIDSIVYKTNERNVVYYTKDQNQNEIVTYHTNGYPLNISSGNYYSSDYLIDKNFAYYSLPDSVSDQDYYGIMEISCNWDENNKKVYDYYDSFGNLRKQVLIGSDSCVLTTKYNYDILGNLTNVIHPNNDTTVYIYDNFWRTKFKINPDIDTLAYAYDDIGRVRFSQSKVQKSNNRVSFIQYDDLNRILVSGEASIDTNNYDYRTSNEWLTEIIDPNIINYYGFNISSDIVNVNKTLWENSSSVLPSFWALQYLDSTRAFPVIQDTLENLNEDLYLMHPVDYYNYLRDTTASIDNFENISIYPDFVKVINHYDELPERIGIIWSSFPEKHYWDSIVPYYPWDRELKTPRNLIGRKSAVAYRDNGNEPFHYLVYSYDPRGRIQSLLRYTENLGFDAVYYTYNSLNQIINIRVVDPLRQHVSWYAYDDNGRVEKIWTTLTEPGTGLGTVDLRYPEMPQRPLNPDIIYTYNKTGNIDTLKFLPAHLTQIYSYNARGWIDSLIAKDNYNQLFFKQSFERDNVGNITKQSSQHRGGQVLNQTYKYDGFYRLTNWSDQSDSLQYFYDLMGNRQKTVKNLIDTSFYNYNSLISSNRLTNLNENLSSKIYQYNSIGAVVASINITGLDTILHERFAYLNSGRIKFYTKSFNAVFNYPCSSSPFTRTIDNSYHWQYRNSPLGDREQKRLLYSPHGDSICNIDNFYHDWTYYLLGPGGEQLAVYKGVQIANPDTLDNSGRRVYMYSHSYIAAGGSLVTLADSTKQFNVFDNLGSCRSLISVKGINLDVQSIDYKPFGDTLNSTAESRIGFIGKERDRENNYFAMGMRQYDATTGRFLSIDPLFEKFREQTPYQYSFNNPLSFKDPTGLEPESEKGGEDRMLTNAVQDLLEESFAAENAMQAMFAEMRALMSWNIFCDEYGIDVYTGQRIGMWDNYYAGGGGSGGARTGEDSENGQKGKNKKKGDVSKANEQEKSEKSKVSETDLTDVFNKKLDEFKKLFEHLSALSYPERVLLFGKIQWEGIENGYTDLKRQDRYADGGYYNGMAFKGDDFGNYAFGFAARCAGIDPITMLAGAGIAGLLTGSAHDWGNFIGIFDTFRDSNMIFRGWFYGKR